MILKLLLNTQNDMVDIYKNIEEYNPNERLKMLGVFDDIVAIIIIKIIIIIIIKIK